MKMRLGKEKRALNFESVLGQSLKERLVEVKLLFEAGVKRSKATLLISFLLTN